MFKAGGDAGHHPVSTHPTDRCGTHNHPHTQPHTSRTHTCLPTRTAYSTAIRTTHAPPPPPPPPHSQMRGRLRACQTWQVRYDTYHVYDHEHTHTIYYSIRWLHQIPIIGCQAPIILLHSLRRQVGSLSKSFEDSISFQLSNFKIHSSIPNIRLQPKLSNVTHTHRTCNTLPEACNIHVKGPYRNLRDTARQ